MKGFFLLLFSVEPQNRIAKATFDRFIGLLWRFIETKSPFIETIWAFIETKSQFIETIWAFIETTLFLSKKSTTCYDEELVA